MKEQLGGEGMDEAMDDVIEPEEEQAEDRPLTAPRPGDEHAYEDTWYRALSAWEHPEADESDEE